MWRTSIFYLSVFGLSERWWTARHAVQIAMIVLCLAAGGAESACPETPSGVASPNLQDIFIGRCHDWQTLIHPELACGNRKKNCTLLWEKFAAGFAHQPLCDVSRDAFRDFLIAADPDIPSDKRMFYSSTYGLAQRYADRGQRYFTLEASLPGYIVNGLHFCGSDSSPDGVARNTACPSARPTTNCTASAEHVFWASASADFASKAQGEAQVLLNASSSRSTIIRNTSFFHQYELPNLSPARVRSFHFLLINDDPANTADRCKEASIESATEALEQKGISVTCQENPRDALLLLCADKSSAPAVCRQVASMTSLSEQGASPAPILLSLGAVLAHGMSAASLWSL